MKRTAPDVVVHGRGIDVSRVWRDVPAAEARHRYGGVDPLAVVGGGLAGVGALALLAVLIASVLGFGYSHGWHGRGSLTLTALIAGAAAIALVGLLAGWVAGRAGRYDGARNGTLAGLVFVIVAAGLVAAVASQDQLFQLSALPSWVPDKTQRWLTLLIAVAAAIGAVVLATLAGARGGHWHRKADDLLLSTRPGGVSTYPQETPVSSYPEEVV